MRSDSRRYLGMEQSCRVNLPVREQVESRGQGENHANVPARERVGRVGVTVMVQAVIRLLNKHSRSQFESAFWWSLGHLAMSSGRLYDLQPSRFVVNQVIGEYDNCSQLRQ